MSVAASSVARGSRAEVPRRAARTAAVTPRRGEWKGQTIQGRLILFDVKRSGAQQIVDQLNTDVRQDCSDGTHPHTLLIDLSATIGKGNFFARKRFKTGEYWAKGKFSNSTHVGGALRSSYHDVLHPGVSCDSAIVHWSAKLRVPTQ